MTNDEREFNSTENTDVNDGVNNAESATDEPVVEMGDVGEYADIDQDATGIPITSKEERTIPNAPAKTFLGEIVNKRHPVLIAIVMLFAFFLAVAPLLFRYQKNAMTDALVIYKAVCDRTSSGRITDDWMKSISGPGLLMMTSEDRANFFERIECLPDGEYRSALRPVKGMQFGPKRAYVLSIHQSKDIKTAEKEGARIINLYFPMIDETLKIDVMPPGGGNR